MHFNGTGRDPPPDSEPYIRDIECEHGGLQPDPKRRIFITKAVRSISSSSLLPSLILVADLLYRTT